MQTYREEEKIEKERVLPIKRGVMGTNLMAISPPHVVKFDGRVCALCASSPSVVRNAMIIFRVRAQISRD